MIELDDLADRYVDDFAALDPCRAAMMGIAGQDARLTDYSPEGFAARTDLSRRTLAALEALPEQDGSGRVAAAVLRERLEAELALDEARVTDNNLDTIDGPVQRLRQAFELLDDGADTPWEAMRSRLRALPGSLEGLRITLTRARQEGRVVARRQVLRNVGATAQAEGYVAGIAAGYGEGPLRAELDAAVAAATRALAEFATFLSEELAPHAPERDALGRDRYELGVRDFLGTRLDLADTYAWGWEELARIKTEIDNAAERVLPAEPLPTVLAALDADPRYRVRGAEAFRAWLQELADGAIADLHGTHFDIPEPLHRVDCRIPAEEGGVYYLAPAEDLSRPGTVWWGVSDPDQEIVTWGVPATMFHEGAPGHHLQLGVTTLNTSTLNRFQRLSSELFPGHCEGWGLYAERLMGELGYYRDPAHRLGMWAGGQRFRAARIVVDIGLHLELEIPRGAGFHEGERWTPELALEFMRANTTPDTAVAFEIDRYLGRPAQAIAYKIGEKVWLEAREEARRREGAAFDLKEFHRRALDLGPMGLDMLRRELARG